MSDLVERLREEAEGAEFSNNYADLVAQAADRIEQLEWELAEAKGLIAKIKDDLRDTEDSYRTEVDFSDHLKTQLAVEKALADRLWNAWQGDGYAPDAVAAYRKARGL